MIDARERWKRTRTYMAKARYDKGETECPCCGTPMFFYGLEYWESFSARHYAYHGPPPRTTPKQIGRLQASVDHLLPRSRGGTDHPSNLFVMCGYCNNDKDNLSVPAWLKSRERRKRPIAEERAKRLLKRWHKMLRVKANYEKRNLKGQTNERRANQNPSGPNGEAELKRTYLFPSPPDGDQDDN